MSMMMMMMMTTTTIVVVMSATYSATSTWPVLEIFGWTTSNVEVVRLVSMNVHADRGAFTAVTTEKTCSSPATTKNQRQPLLLVPVGICLQ